MGKQEVFLSLENIPLNYSMAMDEENEIMIRRLTLFFVPIAFAVILVIGLIGNILVIIVVSWITFLFYTYSILGMKIISSFNFLFLLKEIQF